MVVDCAHFSEAEQLHHEYVGLLCERCFLAQRSAGRRAMEDRNALRDALAALVDRVATTWAPDADPGLVEPMVHARAVLRGVGHGAQNFPHPSGISATVGPKPPPSHTPPAAQSTEGESDG